MSEIKKLGSYKILALLNESEAFVVFRAIDQVNERPVILKQLKRNQATPDNISKLEEEYNITCLFESPRVAKSYGIEIIEGTNVLVTEDFGAQSIEKTPNWKDFSLEKKISLAIAMAECLADFHKGHVIHKDVNLSNFVLNNEDQLKLIDFGVSSRISNETQNLSSPEVIEGTLAFISPEQTGRMNRAIDYRSDYYSLGASYYYLFTGLHPFRESSKMQLIHCHIAKNPDPLPDYNPEIPNVLDKIVAKLMKKEAQDRYQTLEALIRDLSTCRYQLKESGIITDFEIAQNDVSPNFRIEDKLYGRDKEVSQLMDAFSKVRSEGIKNLTMVSGFSGIGKSSLIKEIFKPITEAHAYFLNGKFDQYQKDIPFSAIRSALSGFINSLHTESSDKLELWKTQLTQISQDDLLLINELVPELSDLIDIPGESRNLNLENAEKRFNMAVSQFLSLACTEQHPVVIFIDDLQWADNSSLEMIHSWVRDEKISHLMLIGAYRDNQVNETHPLMLMLDELDNKQIEYNRLEVKAISEKCVNQLIADSIKRDKKSTASLAQVVFEKTQGNPFFVEQFLKSLFAEECLFFDSDKTQWQWDFEKIKNFESTSNVVDLLVSNLNKLESGSRTLLSLCAIIGHSIEISKILTLSSLTPDQLKESLQICVKKGYLVAKGQSRQLFQDSFSKIDMTVRFKHDRIQQASYKLIDEKERGKLHALLGSTLLQSAQGPNRDIFEIANHLNLGKLHLSEIEKSKLVEVNTEAALKAKKSAAYQAFYRYAFSAFNEVQSNDWKHNYQRTLEVHELFAEACLLSHHPEQLLKTVETIKTNVQEPLDSYMATRYITTFYLTQMRYKDTVEASVRFFNDVGFKVPFHVKMWRTAIQVLRTTSKIKRMTDQDILSMPEMTDKKSLAICEIARSLSIALYYTNPDAIPYYFSRIMREHILPKGANKHTAYFIAGTGLIFANGFSDFKNGLRFARLVEPLLKARGETDIGAEHLARFLVLHYEKSFESLQKACMKAWDRALQVGDFEFACYQALASLHFRFYNGEKIPKMLSETLKFNKAFQELKQDNSNELSSCFAQFLNNLHHSCPDPSQITGEHFNATTDVPRIMESKYGPAIVFYHFCSIHAGLLFENFEKVEQHIETVLPHLKSVMGTPFYPMTKYYMTVAQFELVKRNSKLKKQHLKQIKKSIQEFQEWSLHGPNYKNKYFHLLAEQAFYKGKIDRAFHLFEKAIMFSKENGFTSDLALIHERFADCLLQINDTKFEENALRAYRYYGQWGATNKTKSLENKYSQLFKASRSQEESENSPTLTSGKTSNSFLDLQAIIESSQRISAEIHMEALIANIMKVIGENAGAEIGYLLLVDDNSFSVSAHFPKTQEDVEMCQSIVNYVSHKKENVIINDGGKTGQFSSDPYFSKDDKKSILCLPIINSGQLKAIVYFENNQSFNTFTTDRIETLKILASQAAISMQNAQLIENLSEKLRMENELKTASLVQGTLLPSPQYKTEYVEVAGFYEPASECGGDWYYYKDLGDKMLLCIADATGHGVSSALVTAAARSAMSILEEMTDQDLGELTAKMNRAIYSCAKGSVYMTYFIALLDQKTGEIQYCNASHHEPVLLPPSQKPYVWSQFKFLMGEPGKLLGQDLAATYPVNHGIIEPGTKLVFYTDGVTELKNSEDRMWGPSNFMRCIAKGANQFDSPTELMDHIQSGIEKHKKGFLLEDDVTYFTFHFLKKQTDGVIPLRKQA